jgi:hypothetical protein
VPGSSGGLLIKFLALTVVYDQPRANDAEFRLPKKREE